MADSPKNFDIKYLLLLYLLLKPEYAGREDVVLFKNQLDTALDEFLKIFGKNFARPDVINRLHRINEHVKISGKLNNEDEETLRDVFEILIKKVQGLPYWIINFLRYFTEKGLYVSRGNESSLLRNTFSHYKITDSKLKSIIAEIYNKLTAKNSTNRPELFTKNDIKIDFKGKLYLNNYLPDLELVPALPLDNPNIIICYTIFNKGAVEKGISTLHWFSDKKIVYSEQYGKRVNYYAAAYIPKTEKTGKVELYYTKKYLSQNNENEYITLKTLDSKEEGVSKAKKINELAIEDIYVNQYEDSINKKIKDPKTICGLIFYIMNQFHFFDTGISDTVNGKEYYGLLGSKVKNITFDEKNKNIDFEIKKANGEKIFKKLKYIQNIDDFMFEILKRLQKKNNGSLKKNDDWFFTINDKKVTDKILENYLTKYLDAPEGISLSKLRNYYMTKLFVKLTNDFRKKWDKKKPSEEIVNAAFIEILKDVGGKFNVKGNNIEKEMVTYIDKKIMKSFFSIWNYPVSEILNKFLK